MNDEKLTAIHFIFDMDVTFLSPTVCIINKCEMPE